MCLGFCYLQLKHTILMVFPLYSAFPCCQAFCNHISHDYICIDDSFIPLSNNCLLILNLALLACGQITILGQLWDFILNVVNAKIFNITQVKWTSLHHYISDYSVAQIWYSPHIILSIIAHRYELPWPPSAVVGNRDGFPSCNINQHFVVPIWDEVSCSLA